MGQEFRGHNPAWWTMEAIAMSQELQSSRPMQPPSVHLNLSWCVQSCSFMVSWLSEWQHHPLCCTSQKPGEHPWHPFPLPSPPKCSLSWSSVDLSRFPSNLSFLSPSPSWHTLPPSCWDHCSGLPGFVLVLWFVFSPAVRHKSDPHYFISNPLMAPVDPRINKIFWSSLPSPSFSILPHPVFYVSLTYFQFL